MDGERGTSSDFIATVNEGEGRYRVKGLEEIRNDIGSLKLGVNGLYLEFGIVLSECER